jgi:WD40 repeat protein
MVLSLHRISLKIYGFALLLSLVCLTPAPAFHTGLAAPTIKARKVADLTLPFPRPSCASFSPDGSKLAFGYPGREIEVWNTATWKSVPQFRVRTWGSFGWDGSEALILPGDSANLARITSSGHRSALTPQSVTSVGCVNVQARPHVAAVGEFTYLSLVKLPSGDLLWRTQAHYLAWVRGLAFSPNGHFLGTYGVSPVDEDGDEDAYVWSTDNGRQRFHVKAPTYGLALSDSAAFLLASPGILKVDLKTGAIVGRIKGSFNAITYAGSQLYVVDRGGQLQLVRAAPFSMLGPVPLESDLTGSLAFAASADQRLLGGSTSEGRFTVWSLHR